ncbi:MAG TPA: zinc ribbon domain-containing protein [Longimicrobiaceae bacterium]|nr:zinc ribbon domain-containing protein [Longimicrobiaceae bacterium]
MSQTCPACSQPVSGRFCTHCGVSLDGAASCESCGQPIPAGGRFCNQCGAPTAATRVALAEAGARRSSSVPWIVTGVAVVALAVAIVLPQTRQSDALAAAPSTPASAAAALASGAGAAGGPMGNPAAIDISSMTPRERADRLYNRIMQSVSAGDSSQAKMFMPMALAAYGMVPDLDLDGHYHLGVLQLVNGDAAAARAEADTILKADPNHLFGLITAAQAERAMGDEAAARGFYRRFLDHYDAQIARKLPEYLDHKQAFPAMKAEAEKAVASS